MTALGSRAHDPRLIDTTSRLVEFLRELATVRRDQVLDVADYPEVHWLADLPEQTTRRPDAAAGEIVLSFDSPVSEPPPDLPARLEGWVDRQEIADAELEAPALKPSGPVQVVEVGSYGDRTPRTETRDLDDVPEIRSAYDWWLLEWQAWATGERLILAQRRWHRSMLAVVNLLSQREDEFEFVLATGLLSWAAPDGTRVRNHLLGTRVNVVLDAQTQRIDVLLEAGVTRIQDRALLEGVAGFESARANWVRERVRAGEGVGLQESVTDVLKDWCDRALDHGAIYRDEWSAEQASATAEVRLAPALVLRARDRASLIDYYDRMLAALSGPDAQAPLGLAQLVTSLEPDERMGFLEDQGATSGAALGADPLFPLAANPEQRQIMTRLRGDNGVVVQGPPGTGKTHTIANLVAALLAQGQRVLVTSQKAQALRVLREKLPKDVAKLCISITDQRRGGSAELEGSVQALSSRFEKYSAEKYERELGQLRQRRADARREEATLVERIRSLREAETYQHDEIAPAYRGRLADIAERLKREAPACDWMPVPLPARASGTPPINATESAELVRLLADETAQRRARTSQLLPEVTTLPPVETVRGLVAAEAAATDSARQAETDLSRRLAACSLDLLARLEETAGAVAAALDHLDLSDDPGLWEQSDWVVRAVTSGLAQQEMFIWEQLHAHQPRVEEARSAMRTLGLRRVALPPFAPSGDESEASQLAAALRLRDYLAGGGKLKRGLFKPAVQRQAEPLLTGALVDGVSPTTVELLSIVIAELEGRAACAELSHGWRLVGVDIPVDQPVPAVVGRISDQYARLDLVMQVWAGVRQATELLAAAMIPVRLATPSRWREYVVALRAVRLRLEADHASSELQTLRERLDLEVAKGMAPPELVAAVVALAGRDIEAYGQCVAALATAHLELREQSRCDDLHERLNAVHPALATRMSRTRTDEEWPERLANWDRAWAWGKAQTFFTAQRQPGLERQLDGILEAATQQVLNVSAKLAAEQAWSICLSRMTSHHAQALRSYQQHMKDFGGGTGRYASRFRRLAREAMAEAAPAVPAWIMPLRQVLETMPPTRDSFDVVIVDEASQASIEALFLLWLAPRVIVVGDDKQCAPSVVSHGELQPLFDKLGTYLPDVPGYLRDAFTPNSSLFDLLGTRFGSVIRLREHFRCMPEIIEYSSRQFYPDEPLVPLRQFGADRLPPLQVVHAPGASTDGTGVRIRNETEAAEIVNQIVACLDDPAYEGKTFGVVVLQGSGQAQLIQNLLLERIATTEWDQRKLRVGTPPDFQGDERDVIFLSMVIAEKRSAITKLEFQRRFNVAASRAKDQMWLFHSVSPDILSPTDLRKSLLTYMLNPPAPFAASTLDDVVADVPYGPPFDSVFEQRVFLRIRERGYHVTPQVEVNGRRIDLVVSGAKGRLAVECDGDHWHTSPEDRENDLDRERELKRAGWKFWRVRESEFYFDPDAALTTLWDELDRRGIHPGEALKEQTEVPTSSWSAVRLPEDEDGSPGDDAESQDEELPPPVAPSPTETRTRQRTGTSAGGKRKAFPTAPVELRLVEQIALPVDVPDIEPDFDSARNDLPLTPGRTAPGYSRSELQALLRWVAGDGQRRSEDDLLATAADVLNSPSPRDQVRTLLRSALRHMLRN